MGDVSSTPDNIETLTERMLTKSPASGYRLWFDTANTAHIYIAEAPSGSTSAQNVFRGIRITLDASGNPLGIVEERSAFSWDNRTGAGWS